MSGKPKRPEIRCLSDGKFFDLMTKEKTNDCAHSTREQISTEKLVMAELMNFIEDRTHDSEYLKKQLFF